MSLGFMDDGDERIMEAYGGLSDIRACGIRIPIQQLQGERSLLEITRNATIITDEKIGYWYMHAS